MEHRSLGVLFGGLVLVATLGGVAAAQTDGAVEPVTFELVSTGPSVSRAWELLNDDQQQATLSLLTEDLADASGATVGTHTWECLLSDPVGWFCTSYLQLEPGTQTSAGTLILMGEFKGFEGEAVAVVGGTGAYAGARGEAILTVHDDGFVRVITLDP